MFQAVLHIDPEALTPTEREAVAKSLRWHIWTYMSNVETSFSPDDVDVRFVASLEGSLPTHVIVGTISGLHRLWGTDHEAMLQIIVKGVIEGARPPHYADQPFLRLEQAARPVAIMPREHHWRDDPRPPDPAKDRSDLSRQHAPPPVRAI